ncbi:hypothetical protein y223_00047 [Bordetella phage PY223]
MSLLNGSELARVLGVSHTAVAKAAKTGRISIAERDEKGRALYDPEKAVQEWGARTDPAQTRSNRKGGRPRKDGTPAQPRVVPTTTPHHPDRPGPSGGRLQTGGGLRGPREPGEPDGDGGSGGTTYNQAAAKEKYYKAELARLEFEQKIGTLVPIANVAQEVEREYTRVRARLLAIPSKLAPDVALSDDVASCRAMIEAAIVDALNELAADTAANGAADDDA